MTLTNLILPFVMCLSTIILMNFNLHYVGKPSMTCNLALSALLVLEKKIFKWLPPCFSLFVIISHLKRTSPFIWINLNSLYGRIICIKFDWKWSAVSGEQISLYKHMYCKSGFPLLWPLPTHGDHDFSKIHTLCQRALMWIWAFLAKWIMRRFSKYHTSFW
jgi:hypothetical protein